MGQDPNFTAYKAKIPSQQNGPRAALRRLKNDVYSAVLFPYGVKRHEHLLATCDRVDNHTYTCFLRAPAQLATLAGPVMDFLGSPQKTGRELELLMFACSNGAEVYTIASWLMQELPTLQFRIQASDLHQEMVDRCIAADYSADEALQSEYVSRAFVEATFDRKGDRYIVKPAIRERVQFRQASLLDRDALEQAFRPADIVTAQNVLFHMKPAMAREAFANAASFLKERSVLMVEGMDPDVRIEATKAHGLRPLTDNLRSIYSETRVHTPRDWWNYYWGTEPYFPLRKERDRRYGTIFVRESGR